MAELTRRRCLRYLGWSGMGLAIGRAAMAAQTQHGASEDFACTDVTGLTDREVMRRRALQYTDSSPKPPQFCDNCQFWQPPADGAGACGACAIVPGLIHPKGWCTAWVPANGAG